MLLQTKIGLQEYEFDVLPIRNEEENKIYFVIRLTQDGRFMLAEKNSRDGSWLNHSRHDFKNALRSAIFNKIETTGIVKILRQVQPVSLIEKAHLEQM